MVWVGSLKIACLLRVESFEAIVCADVDLNIVPVASLVNELVSVTGVGVHLVVAIWCASVRKGD